MNFQFLDILLFIDIGFIIYLMLNYQILSVIDNFILMIAVIFSFLDIDSVEFFIMKILILIILAYKTIIIYNKKLKISNQSK